MRLNIFKGYLGQTILYIIQYLNYSLNLILQLPLPYIYFKQLNAFIFHSSCNILLIYLVCLKLLNLFKKDILTYNIIHIIGFQNENKLFLLI